MGYDIYYKHCAMYLIVVMPKLQSDKRRLVWPVPWYVSIREKYNKT